MKKQLVAILLVLGLGACSPTPTVSPASSSPASNLPTAMPSAIAESQNLAPTIPIPTQPTETIVPVTEAAGTLTLQLLAPQDDSVVNAPQVDVIGLAPVGTVVSVNDDILIVGADGQFRSTVSLDEGPNLLEVVASDESGNEVSQILTVTYEP